LLKILSSSQPKSNSTALNSADLDTLGHSLNYDSYSLSDFGLGF